MERDHTDPATSPFSIWNAERKCPKAPITGPSIPLNYPENLVLPPLQKRISAHSGEVRFLSDPLNVYHQAYSSDAEFFSGMDEMSDSSISTSLGSSTPLSHFHRSIPIPYSDSNKRFVVNNESEIEQVTPHHSLMENNMMMYDDLKHSRDSATDEQTTILEMMFSMDSF